MNRKKIIENFNKLKTDHPDQTLGVETPEETVRLRVGEAIIYEGMAGEIVIDSE